MERGGREGWRDEKRGVREGEIGEREREYMRGRGREREGTER